MPTADWPPIEGGISSLAYHTAHQLAAMGHEVTVIAPRMDGGGLFDDLWFAGKEDPPGSKGVRVLRFPGYALGWLRFFPMLKVLAWHIKDADYILGINVAYGGIAGWLAKGLYKKPYVTFAYAYEFIRFENVPVIRGLLRDVYEDSAFTCAISNFTAARLKQFGVPAEKVRIIFPGAPTARDVSDTAVAKIRKRYLLGDGPVILAVGRMIPRKGHLTLVRAMPAVLKKYPDAVFVFVGRGREMVFLCRAAGAEGVRESLRVPGFLPDQDLAALYKACTLFALPTEAGEGGHVEGFGLVFAEAAAYGKPVVAGRSGGTADAVLHEETGLLVVPGHPDDLAEAIIRLLDDPDFAAKLGEAGRNRVQTELNWRRFTEQLLANLETP